jgi:Ca2+-binding EF-hand superfamily protein
LPEGFPQILKDFTREVLRSQTDDINKFAYEYFTEAIRRRDSPSGDGGDEGSARLNPDELRAKIEELFQDADADGNGFLDRKEFKSVFQGLQDELGLSLKDVKKIMAEADENDDGVIEYAEFAPVAVDVVNSIYAKQDYEAEQEARKEDAIADAREFLLHGMPREELEAMLGDVFQKADADGNGWLSRKEFTTCIKEADLGFTRKEINVLMSEVDMDDDGKISYDEFVPLCFTLLVEMVSDSLVEAPQEEEELRQFFVDLFSSAADSNGLLNHKQVVHLLKQADLGLTRIQIHAIMSEADEDEDGNCEVESLSASVAGMIYNLVNVQMQQERAEKIGSVREMEEYGRIHGYTKEEMEQLLTDSFRDMDDGQSGKLDLNSIAIGIKTALDTVSAKEMQSLLSVAMEYVVEEPDMVAYADVVESVFSVLQWLKEQELLNGM